MVSINSRENSQYVTGWELRGLSSDDKPDEMNGQAVPNGSTFYCIDNGTLYMYDQSNKTWYLQ